MAERRSVGFLKNITIALLVFLSVYQTGKIWFEDLSQVKSIFSSFNIGNSFEPSPEELKLISCPSRTFVSSGNGSFYLKLDFLLESSEKHYLDLVLAELFKSGSFVNSEAVSDQTIQGANLIFQYDVRLTAEQFTQCYGSNSQLLSAKVKTVDQILVSIFVDSVEVSIIDDETSFLYKINSEGLDDLTTEEPDVPIYYIFGKTSPHSALFTDNSFIPVWNGATLLYPTVNSVNDFAEGDSMPRPIVQDKLGSFFDNSNAIFSATIEEVHTFSDENIVVKVSSDRVLEYTNYEAGSDKAVNSLFSAFSVANSFMKKDTGINNSVYISEIKQSEDSWIFKYGCTVNNFPVKFSERYTEQTGLESFIELTVKNDNVTKYKRFIGRFETEQDENAMISAKYNFISTMSAALSIDEENQSTGEGVFSDLELCYWMNENNQLSLFWSMLANGSPYVLPLE